MCPLFFFDSLNPSFLAITPRLCLVAPRYDQPLLCEGNLLACRKSSCPKELTNCCIFALKTHTSKDPQSFKVLEYEKSLLVQEECKETGLWEQKGASQGLPFCPFGPKMLCGQHSCVLHNPSPILLLGHCFLCKSMVYTNENKINTLCWLKTVVLASAHIWGTQRTFKAMSRNCRNSTEVSRGTGTTLMLLPQQTAPRGHARDQRACSFPPFCICLWLYQLPLNTYCQV